VPKADRFVYAEVVPVYEVVPDKQILYLAILLNQDGDKMTPTQEKD
jgi:hypothetical protein